MKRNQAANRAARRSSAAKRDSSDVVSGPIGSASLRDPATAGVEGGGVAQLPTVAAPGPAPDAPHEDSGPART